MSIGNYIAGSISTKGSEVLQSTNPSTQQIIEEKFLIASELEMNVAVKQAYTAWNIYKHWNGRNRGKFLRSIAEEIENIGDALIFKAMEESGLPEGRIRGERGRTCNQLRLFASLVEEGHWVNATIDEALPERQPLPRVDLRKMELAVGPVVVFGASNFPLAFSTAGGDTASAFAAGCPVIVKAHPSHLGTNMLVSKAINIASQKCGLPLGIYSSVVGSIKEGQYLVGHPMIKAVGFTGSFRGGRALMDIACNRTEPIPVYAEMGSVNPVFIFPSKIEHDVETLSDTIAGSVNLGAGQFCTNPGIIVVQKGSNISELKSALEKSFASLTASTMLNEGIFNHYNKGVASLSDRKEIDLLHQGTSEGWKGRPAVGMISAKKFTMDDQLQDEIFGPFTLVVVADNLEEMESVASHFKGQLTATVMGSTDEFTAAVSLIDVLTQKVGRLIFNGVPTGVEVSHAMHHGGPYPSSSNGRFTSVGTDAIYRFTRPVTYQNAPDSLLPDALKRDNPLKIKRTVNGTRE